MRSVNGFPSQKHYLTSSTNFNFMAYLFELIRFLSKVDEEFKDEGKFTFFLEGIYKHT